MRSSIRDIFVSRGTRRAALVITVVLPVLLAAYAWFINHRPALHVKAEWTWQDTLIRKKVKARELTPIALMAALCVVGRAAFALIPLPNFKPVSAIIIITALAFGPEAGYLTGALAAILSNFLFGQGPWTPWQMFCWGLLGFLAGLLGRMGLFGPVGRTAADEKGKRKKPVALCIYGFAGGFLYGWIMNIYYIIGWVRPFSWKAAGAAYVSSFFFDLSHGICTALVLLLVGEAWVRKLLRIRKKFGLTGEVRRYELPPSFRAMEGEHP